MGSLLSFAAAAVAFLLAKVLRVEKSGERRVESREPEKGRESRVESREGE
jgi:hypothetical protein